MATTVDWATTTHPHYDHTIDCYNGLAVAVDMEPTTFNAYGENGARNQRKVISHQEFTADNWTELTARMQYVWNVLYAAAPELDEIDHNQALLLSWAFNH